MLHLYVKARVIATKFNKNLQVKIKLCEVFQLRKKPHLSISQLGHHI